MNFAKAWPCAILVSFLFVFEAVFAFNFDLDFIAKDNYTEFSETDSKRVIGLLPSVLEKKWINYFSNNQSPKESTAISFLRDASIFDFWNYTLADLPTSTVVNTLKIIANDFSSEDAAKKLISKIEKLSVTEAVRIAKEELFANKAKVSFGAIRGMNSKDNKEIIFQYVIVYKPISDNKGLMTIRFYSPQEILPPQTKASYGLALGFVNMLDDGEKLPPFMVEIKGEVEDALSGSYKFNSLVKTDIAFSDSIPDLGLVPISWQDRYVVNPIRDFLQNIPVVGQLFDSEKVEILKGSSGNNGMIKKEIMKVINGETINAKEVELDKEILNDFTSDNKKENAEGKKEKAEEKKQKAELKKKQKDQEAQRKKEEKELEKKQKQEEKIKKEEERLRKKEEALRQKEEALRIKEEKKLFKEQERQEKEKQKEQEKEKKEKQEKEKQVKELEKELSDEMYSKKCPRESSAQIKRTSVIFNELAWMGSRENSSYEWIELKNIGNQPVDINGWKIYGKASSEDFVFKESHVVLPGEYLLLEKNEKAIPWIDADFIFSGSLNNSDEKYYLYDVDCSVQDFVSAVPDWPAGSNEEKRTMENAGDFSWHTYSGSGVNGIFGTPKTENSKFDNAVEERVRRVRFPDIYNPPKRSGSSVSSNTSQKNVNYCTNQSGASPLFGPVIVNEIAWMGTSISSNDEWIELRNNTNEEVNLKGWQLLDKNGDIKIVFDEADKIEANGFYLLERTDDNSIATILADKIYSGGLSDGSESLALFNSSCELVDNIDAVNGWTAGNEKDKRSMERENNYAWHTYSGGVDSSGLYATPHKSNSGNENIGGDESNGQGDEGGEDEEENDEGDEESDDSEVGDDNNEDQDEDEQNSEDEDEENDENTEISQVKITNLEIIQEDTKNSITLKWPKLRNDLEYEIYYSIDNPIAENLVLADKYFDIDFSENEENEMALISGLYFGKNYNFAIKAKKLNEYSLLSNAVSISIADSSPLLAFKNRDYGNSLYGDFEGPATYSDKNINDLSGAVIQNAGNFVVGANGDMYLLGEINGEFGLSCFGQDGVMKWKFSERGGDPTIGKDGTIYFNNSEYVFALSPAGKLKWKEKFLRITSRNITLANNGAIFILASDGEYRPALYSLQEKNEVVEKKELVSAHDLWGETPANSFSEISMDNSEFLYFSISNALVKYNIGNNSFEKRTIKAYCSPSYASQCDNYLPNIMSIIVFENNIYVSVNNAYINDYANLNGISVFDKNNFLGNPLWSLGSYSTLAVDNNALYVYNATSSIFSTKSYIVGLNINTGKEKYRKEWNDASPKTILFIDNKGIVYVKIGSKIFGYDFINITSGNPQDNLIFEIDSGSKNNVSVFSDGVLLSGNGAGVIKK